MTKLFFLSRTNLGNTLHFSSLLPRFLTFTLDNPIVKIKESMAVAGSHRLPFFAFFPHQQNFNSAQVDTLLRETSDFFTKEKVLFIVNAGSIVADAGDFKQSKPFPITEGLFMHADFCRDLCYRQYHVGLLKGVDNTLYNPMTAVL